MRSVLLIGAAGGLLAAALAAGCRHDPEDDFRRTFDVPLPDAATPEAPVPSRGPIFVGAITDARHFENKPDDPSRPSVPGDFGALTPKQQDGLIGRMRGPQGQAGDNLRTEGPGVTEDVRALIKEGLTRHGYTVTDDPHAPVSLTATIIEFWEWWRPTIAGTEIYADVTLTMVLKRAGRPQQMAAEGHGYVFSYQALPWLHEEKTVFRHAFAKFLERFDAQLALADKGALPPPQEAVVSPAPPAVGGNADARAKLKELKAMRDDGLISAQDYEKKKQEILDSM